MCIQKNNSLTTDTEELNKRVDPPRNTVLIVDDNQINRIILRKQIEENYGVIEAENGAEALKRLQEKANNISIVLLDIVMPVMDGYTFLIERKKDPDLESVPVIVLTGKESSDSEVKALRLGANDFLTKPYNFLTINLRIKNLLKLKRTQAEKETVELVVNNIPSGVIVYEITDKVRFRYINDSIYYVSGYTKEEYLGLYKNNPVGAVYVEDRPLIEKVIAEQVSHNQNVEVEFRVENKTGTLAWHLLKANYVATEGTAKIYYGVISNTTEQKKTQALLERQQLELRASYEKLRIALKATNLEVLEYDIVNRTLLFRSEAQNDYGFNSNEIALEELLKNTDLIHPEDQRIFENAFASIDKGCSPLDVVVRIKRRKRWCFIRYTFTTVYDSNEKPILAMGTATDVTGDVTNKLRAQQDALTGLFNRITFESFVKEALQKESFSAFFIIDLDDFKTINDRYGHIVGDAVIRETAKQLKSIFREDDIVGRVGGDEMAVLMIHLGNAFNAYAKGLEICQALNQCQVDDYVIPVSCSVGIAFFPEHGTTFDALYNHSDQAMYRSKELGKNQCTIYNSDVISPQILSCVNETNLLDILEDYIFVIDIETYALLYMNKAGMRYFKITRRDFGRKCYDLLKGSQKPCCFCTDEVSPKGNFSLCECGAFVSPKKILLKNKRINWNGRPALFEIAAEIES